MKNDTDNTLELLAERANVEVESIPTGKIRLSKKIISETVQIPVTLNREVLLIEYDDLPDLTKNVNVETTNPVNTTVVLNGKIITLTEKPLELLLNQQVARVKIDTIINEKVELTISENTVTEQIPITLRHEELVIEETKLT
ncbi:hypothetical protein MOMA_04325 [Moraxella macacae 0408225]|uniref:DUF2382 domain-containing protein n=1 Tax=Moraxella macacae 0408225 TaxID=1230338 RepID=L2FA36_9GAMM|nr:DUF2382 domain-containing protein [Moraxella macacae]ELA09601.1 hypothetical protein MOMA_04325 [Moraxella macacae 0408225]